MKKIILVSSLALACALPAASHAESNVNGAAVSTSSVTSRLDFTVVVPSVLFLRIGTGGAIGVAGTIIDGVTFNVPATNIGDGIAIAGIGGDLTNGAVTVRVFSNFGSAVNLTSSVAGPLTSGPDTISWAQISVVPSPLAAPTKGFPVGNIVHPAFNTAAAGGVGLTPTSLSAIARLVRYECQWTYSYSNTNVVPAGIYGATTPGSNGRVTYTATQV